MSERVLVIAAHSDDEALGCGGTIAAHARAGDRVEVLFMTDGVGARGSGSAEAAARADASAKALRILGVAKHENLDFPDNRMDSVPLIEVTKAIEARVDAFAPSIVYTHHGGDLNVDHRVTHEATMTALRPLPGSPTRTVLAFEVMSSTEWRARGPGNDFRPSWHVDITDDLQAKLDALGAYEAEMRPWPHSRSIRALDHLARRRGADVGVEAAEAFELLRHIRTS